MDSQIAPSGRSEKARPAALPRSLGLRPRFQIPDTRCQIRRATLLEQRPLPKCLQHPTHLVDLAPDRNDVGPIGVAKVASDDQVMLSLLDAPNCDRQQMGRVLGVRPPACFCDICTNRVDGTPRLCGEAEPFATWEQLSDFVDRDDKATGSLPCVEATRVPHAVVVVQCMRSRKGLTHLASGSSAQHCDLTSGSAAQQRDLGGGGV